MKLFLRKYFPRAYYKISRAKEWVRRRMFRARNVRHTYSGYSFEIHLADGMGEGWYDTDWDMLPEIPLMQQSRLTSGARVFDIGAHQAIVAMIYARFVGEKGTVVAVEAEPFHAAIARRNRDLNALPHLKVVEAAVAERTGPLPAKRGFDRSVKDRFLDWRSEGVRGISLDDLVADFGIPDVLIVDVDGFECHVLRGGSRTLSSFPDCMVEVHVGVGLEQENGSVEEVLSFFPPKDWTLWVAPGNWSGFVPFDHHLPLLRRRFMLVAIAANKRSISAQSHP